MNLKQIIGEELFNQLPEEKKKEYAKQDLQDVSEGKYVPKDRFDQVNQQSKDYKEQVSERDRQIESLKNEFKDVDGLKDKVEQLTRDNAKQKEDYENQIKTINFNNALKASLSSYNCKDEDYLMSKIDRNSIKLNSDGTIFGLKEQVEAFKKGHEYLLEKEIKGTGSFNTGGGSSEGNTPKFENFAERFGKQRAEAIKNTKDISSFAAN